MKCNLGTCLEGSKIWLVPYRNEHVPKYHEWMLDPKLQELTESEPLSLEEEYQMQRDWANDEDKLTFIVLDKRIRDEQGASVPTAADVTTGMCGDVNIFLHDDEDPEIEVMIAEEDSRRGGLATEALQLMMVYGQQQMNMSAWIAKIVADNVPSRRLFEKIGYSFVKEVKVFNEVVYRYDVKDASNVELLPAIRQHDIEPQYPK